MTETASFPQRLTRDWPRSQWAEVHVVAAVSGGPDSVALLRALVALRDQPAERTAREAPGGAGEPVGQLLVAHVDHRLREESAAEARFVERLAAELHLPCVVRAVDTRGRAEAVGDGVEAAARDLRYEALREIAHEFGARYVATGHTADDQAETVLHRILRGTSPAGLAGMRRSRPLSESVTLIRPLLGFRRSEIEAYLTGLGQPFCSDASNFESHYTRNRIRRELMPHLAEHYNPAIVEALLRLGQGAAEAHEALDDAAAMLAAAAVSLSRAERIEIDCRQLVEASDYLRRLMLNRLWADRGWPQQAMSRAHWERLAALTHATSSSGRIDLPGGVTAEKKEAGQLVLTRLVG